MCVWVSDEEEEYIILVVTNGSICYISQQKNGAENKAEPFKKHLYVSNGRIHDRTKV